MYRGKSSSTLNFLCVKEVVDGFDIGRLFIIAFLHNCQHFARSSLTGELRHQLLLLRLQPAAVLVTVSEILRRTVVVLSAEHFNLPPPCIRTTEGDTFKSKQTVSFFSLGVGWFLLCGHAVMILVCPGSLTLQPDLWFLLASIADGPLGDDDDPETKTGGFHPLQHCIFIFKFL
ncbi:hypothetical protein Dimus_038220 [Dionaea muscipula]